MKLNMESIDKEVTQGNKSLKGKQNTIVAFEEEGWDSGTYRHSDQSLCRFCNNQE